MIRSVPLPQMDGAVASCFCSLAAFVVAAPAHTQTAQPGGPSPAAHAQTAQPGGASPAASSDAQGAQGATADTSDAQQGPTPIAVPLPKGKKLVMNDGSFQIVREYTREGDRVRYYSLERSDWEEIPASLVNWDATQKAETERQAQDQALVEKIKESARAKRVADVDSDRSFEARPGIVLPDAYGLYALDGDVIRTMQQDHAEAHFDKARTFERVVTGVPLIKSKQEVEIPGKHAKLRMQSGDPEFYFRTIDERDPQMTLLRVEINGDNRALETITTDMVGQNTYKNREVATQEWDAAHGLYRFTVEETLSPGEYALIETTPEGHSLYVWDFGVDGEADGNSKRK